MKKINITRMVLAAIMMVFGAANLMADVGDLITTKTKEGVKMTFVVEKDDRCSVYSDCIDKSVTGIVTIPEEVYGNTVVGINNEAFRDCSVSEIVIPQTVKFIGNNAFRDCKKLEEMLVTR